jgi:hypothetical protein
MCEAANEVHIFPAALAPSGGAAQPETAEEGEAACFDHPAKRATASCSQCGRFVCALCAVDFGDAIWCPTCVAAGAGKARAAKAETSRTLYDSMVLSLPLVALLLWPLTAIAAPAALVLGFSKMREPLSIVRTTRWRLWLGMTISVVEIAGWVWGILYLIASLSSLKGAK